MTIDTEFDPLSSDILLLTTCDMKSGRLDDLHRLVSSVKHQIDCGLKVKHIILLQRSSSNELIDFLTDEFIVLNVETLLSLSAARNHMLTCANERGLIELCRYVAFPDDDAWYPGCNLYEIVKFLDANPKYNMFGCDYGASPESINYPLSVNTSSFGHFIKVTSSNTLIVRSSVVKLIGVFDDRLGVGAEFNGGEDSEYATRSYVLGGGEIAVVQKKLIGHRDRQRWVRGRYYIGGLIALSRYASCSKNVFLQAVRKVMVGGYLTLRRELTIFEYFKALKLALSAYRGSLRRCR